MTTVTAPEGIKGPLPARLFLNPRPCYSYLTRAIRILLNGIAPVQQSFTCPFARRQAESRLTPPWTLSPSALRCRGQIMKFLFIIIHD